MQNKKLSGVRTETGGTERSDRRIRFEVLRPEPFLIHNAHILSGRSADKAKCRICKGGLGFNEVVAKGEVSRDVVDESGGADTEETATPSFDSQLWKNLTD